MQVSLLTHHRLDLLQTANRFSNTFWKLKVKGTPKTLWSSALMPPVLVNFNVLFLAKKEWDIALDSVKGICAKFSPRASQSRCIACRVAPNGGFIICHNWRHLKNSLCIKKTKLVDEGRKILAIFDPGAFFYFTLFTAAALTGMVSIKF